MLLTLLTILTVGFLAIYFLLWRERRHPKAPPGPPPLPLLGNLLDLARASDSLLDPFAKLGEKYGEIYSIKIGLKNTVVLTSKEAIEALIGNEALDGRDRSSLGDKCYGRNLGIALAEGDLWYKTRTWTFKTLKEYGFSKSANMECNVQTMCQNLFTEVIDNQMKERGIVNVELMFSQYTLQSIWLMMVGTLNKEDSEGIKKLAHLSEQTVRTGVFGMALGNAYPFLTRLCPGLIGHKKFMEYFTCCDQLAFKFLTEAKQRVKTGQKTINDEPTFVEKFAEKLMANPNDTVFNDKNFQVIIQDVFMGSMETTSSLMEACILFLALNPNVQDKLCNEISQTFESGQCPTLSERKKMTYAQAFFLETHRLTRVLQNYVPHVAVSDVSYKGYLIQKGTVVLVDTYTLCFDPNVWSEPNEFRPERWIKSEGQVATELSTLPFGVGKRNCPGSNFAENLYFLMIITILQNYTVKLDPSQPKPRQDMMPGLSYKPYPFQVLFEKKVKN